MNKLERAKIRGLEFYKVASERLNEYFDSEYSVIDVGAGNGCCGFYWPNYTYFVDKRKPKTFEKLNKHFKKQNFEYNETPFEDFKLESVEGDKAIIGIHTCNELTDLIIDKSISEGMPFAIVPCCYPNLKTFNRYKEITPLFFNNITRYIDDKRKTFLKQADFNCEILNLENLLSDMNKLILGMPKSEYLSN